MSEERTRYTEKIVLSLGGSLVVPQEGIDTSFLKKFNTFIRDQVKDNPTTQFFVVVGGGATARKYIEAGQEVVGHELTRDDLDWLGIHTTRLNAQLLRTIFQDIAHPYILKHYEIIRKVEEAVVIGSGWKPGWSTDYCAAVVCEDYGVKQLINLSNIAKVYDKDPKNNPDAKPIDQISWEDFRKIVGDEWIPGMNAPFDPVAARKAQELGLKVVVAKGDDLENLHNYLTDKQFEGTVIG